MDETYNDGAKDETLAAPESSQPPLDHPQRINRFAVLRKLGSGGMGVVYSAYDEELDRRVAIKVLRKIGDKATERMRREAQAMAKVVHPNVAAVYEVGRWEGQIYMAIEFVRGGTLRDWLRAEDRSVEDVLGVLVQAGRGLEAAHLAGLVHRDFKPDNAMVGDDGRVRVLDFGLAGAETSGATDVESLETEIKRLAAASPFSSPLTETGTMMGTPAYMSPEQFAVDAAGPASDQFSFCVTAYEALYGERPFAGKGVIALGLNVSKGNLSEPPPGKNVPAWLRSALLRGLAVNPKNRHADMSALLDTLERGVRGPKDRVKVFTSLGLGGGVLAAAVYFGSGYAAEKQEEIEAMQAEAAAAEKAREEERAAEEKQRAQLEARRLAEAARRELEVDRPLRALAYLDGALKEDPDSGEVVALLEQAMRGPVAYDTGWELEDATSTISEPLPPEDPRYFQIYRSTEDGNDDALLSTVFLRALDGPPEELVFEGHEAPLRSVELSPDGTKLLTGAEDGSVRIWSMESQQAIRIIEAFEPEARLRVKLLEGTREALEYEDGELSNVAVAAWISDDELVTGGADGVLRWWNANTGEVLRERPTLGLPIVQVDTGPDAERLAVRTTDATIHVVTGSGVSKRFREASKLHFSPTGSHALVFPAMFRGGRGRSATLVRTKGWSEVEAIKTDSAFAFSPDGALLASKDRDEGFVLRDVNTAEVLRVFEEDGDDAQSVAFSDDASKLAVGMSTGEVRVYSTESGRRLARLPVKRTTQKLGGKGFRMLPPKWVRWVGFGADGETVRASSMRALARWKNILGRRKNTVGEQKAFTVARGSEHVLTFGGDGKLNRRDETLKSQLSVPLRPEEEDSQEDAGSPSGAPALFTNRAGTGVVLIDDGQAFAWRGDESRPQPLEGQYEHALVGHDGTKALLIPKAEEDEELEHTDVWHFEGGKRSTIPFRLTSWPAPNFAPSDDVVVGVLAVPDEDPEEPGEEGSSKKGGFHHALVAVKLDTGRELARHEIMMMFLAVAVSPKGTLAAASEMMGAVHSWNYATGEHHVFHGHRGPAMAVALSPEGDRIVSGGSDRSIRVWDVATKEQLVTIEADQGQIQRLEWSAGGEKILADGQEGAKLWSARDGRLLATYDYGDDESGAARFGATSGTVLTFSESGELVLWRAGSYHFSQESVSAAVEDFVDWELRDGLLVGR